MFEKMFANLGKMPDPISIEEYISRQNELYSTFQSSDVLILCSSPETIHSNDAVSYTHLTLPTNREV